MVAKATHQFDAAKDGPRLGSTAVGKIGASIMIGETEVVFPEEALAAMVVAHNGKDANRVASAFAALQLLQAHKTNAHMDDVTAKGPALLMPDVTAAQLTPETVRLLAEAVFAHQTTLDRRIESERIRLPVRRV